MPARLIFYLLAAILFFSTPALAEKRVALVIGNDAYANLPASQQLKKAVNDARAMADTLRGLGFDTLLGINIGRTQFNRKLQEIANKVEPGDTVAVFFAGHGVQISDLNYLLPSDVPHIRSGQEALLKLESVRVGTITETLNARGPRITLLILDACRDNPFKDSKGRSIGGTRGLARMTPAQGTFVMYSAGTGQQALDRLSDNDANPNSVFTRTLLPLMRQPGLEIGELAKQVKRGVHELALKAGHEQVPAVYNEMLNDFFLAGGAKGQTQQVASAPAPAPVLSEKDAFDFARSIGTIDGWDAFLAKFPDGAFAAFAKAARNKLVAGKTVAAVAPPQAASSGAAPQSANAGFIFPNSHLRRITVRELISLSKKDLRIARNEIYARKGRFFKSRDLQVHFGKFSWYQPHTWNPSLTRLERLNVRTIQAVEKRR